IHPNADKSKRTTITRHQYGLVPAFSFTDYKPQGQTIDHVIVDIGKPGTGGISQFNAYVAISRGRGPEKFRFLRDFDSRLFTSGIDEDLAEEDRRLEGLNRVTKARYEKLALVLKLAVRFLQQSGTKVLGLAWDLLKTLLARCRAHRSANQDTTPSPLLNSDLGTQDASASAAPDPPKDHPPQFGLTKTTVPQLDVPEPRATAHPISLEFDSTEGTAPAQMDSPNLVSPTTDASALHQPNFEPTRPSFRGYVKEPEGTPSGGGSYSDVWRCPIRFITPAKEHPTEVSQWTIPMAQGIPRET
ncbi:hypothetical protein FRC01_005966, partial [Tulasnella sp. 417]